MRIDFLGAAPVFFGSCFEADAAAAGKAEPELAG